MQVDDGVARALLTRVLHRGPGSKKTFALCASASMTASITVAGRSSSKVKPLRYTALVFRSSCATGAMEEGEGGKEGRGGVCHHREASVLV